MEIGDGTEDKKKKKRRKFHKSQQITAYLQTAMITTIMKAKITSRRNPPTAAPTIVAVRLPGLSVSDTVLGRYE